MTDWLSLARDSFNSSTSYIDANYRRQIEDNINMFNSKHVSNSKYHSDSYKHRSRLFRPKSRSTVRKNEALAASAYFSNIDVVNIDAEMQSDPAQLASASINKELLQYRLTKTIPWFQLLIGAFQQAQVDGVVCSYQDWDYREKTTKRTYINMFNSKHVSNSKYHSDSYKHRSRLFRPKSRSTVRKNEALAASAYFSNIDVVNIDAEMQSDPAQLASASINKELLQYRLTKTIPWFQLLIGAFQQAQVDGVVCSYQDWDYREKTTKRTVDNGFGEEVEIEDVKVLSDKPVVKLVPFENIRFDPSSDWVDVVGTSPYLIEMLPMYAADVKLAMNTNDPKTGQPKFKKLSDEDIRVAVNATADTTRS